MLMTDWTMAYAPGEIQSLKQAQSWTHKTKDDFAWSYRPTHGHHHIETQPGAPRPAYTLHLALSISFKHTGKASSTALHPV